MKVAIWLKEHVTSPKLGGGHSYYKRFIELVDDRNFPEGIEVCFASFGDFSGDRWNKDIHFMTPKFNTASLFQRIAYRLFSILPFMKARLHALDQKIIEQKKARFVEYLTGQGIDMIMYPTQMTYDARLKRFPCIMINWDLGHMSSHGLPEFIQPGGLEYRQKFYSETLHRATLVITESNAGKEELVRFLNFNPEKIEVAPQFPGHLSFMSVADEVQEKALEKFGLESNKFYFYPAQFWPHKNHYNLIKAFRRIANDHNHLKLVFTGSDKGNMTYIKRVVSDLKLDEKVLFLGFVEDEELFALYKHAIGLMMPTLLGPTNMPLLEALYLDCPAAVSGLKGHYEQLGDSALYFAPENDREIYDALSSLLNPSVRTDLLEKMKAHRQRSEFSEKNYMHSLEQALLKVARIRKCWGNKSDEIVFW